jgi:23S rRNA (cytosine1962-C5)-methyltransferase
MPDGEARYNHGSRYDSPHPSMTQGNSRHPARRKATTGKNAHPPSAGRRREHALPRRATAPEGTAAIVLAPGREKSLLRRHPWVFSGAVERIEGEPENGATVAVCDGAGGFLAWAGYSANSQITAKVWSWEANVTIDGAFFRRRMTQALTLRRDMNIGGAGNGMRLIHAESDGLPGLIVDQYGDVLVMQLGSAAADRWRDTWADILQELCQPVCIYERSDSDTRALEGLENRNGVLRGALPGAITVSEHGLKFAVDVAHGQKTGFYLDQRDNRALTGTLAQDKDVLNCFCYTGGFSLYALRGGAASVLSIDASEEALELARRNVELNGLDAARAEWQCADVFAALRKLRDQNRKFDLIVLDPPKFAPTAAFAEKAARGYKDINLLGLKLLKPGGLLFTYSCSGGISEDLFQKIIAGAALDAGVDACIVHKLHAAADHPVLLSFPEGAYLKGLVVRVAG